MKFSTLLGRLALAVAFAGVPAYATSAPVKELRITVLSTMLAGALDKGIGEWGFSALVEVDGGRLLFDTGQRPNTVLNNARELGIDLTEVETVVLSHNHGDHVGGLLTLRKAFAEKAPKALSTVHVAEGIFTSRGPGRYAGDENQMIAIKPGYEALGGHFVVHPGAVELLPGVWFTGPIPRPYPDEQPIPKGWEIRSPDGSLVPDPTPEDSALVFDTSKGLVVLTGCGHAGLINLLEYARVITGKPEAKIHAVTGGFHLAMVNDDALDWTATKLKEMGLERLHGGHCTGLEAVYRVRRLLGLPREAASVAAVGSWFDLEKGIHPLVLAQ